MLSDNASRLLVPIIRNAAQKRMQSVVSGPPTQHVSKTEIFVLGSTIVASVVAYPAWILTHLNEYKGR